MANKQVGNRQKKIVAPARTRPARPSRTPSRDAAPVRRNSRVLLLNESMVKNYDAAARAIDPAIQILACPEEGELPAGAERTEIFLRWWEGGKDRTLKMLLDAAPNLKWVHTPSAGIDHLPLSTLRERGIVLTNARGVHSIPIAESVMAFLLARAKQSRAHLEEQENRRFEMLKLDELTGKNLLLYGYGSIGREIALRARAFGMRVSAVRRGGARDRDLQQVFSPGKLSEAVAQADAVVIAAPLTEETRGAFDFSIFAAMKADCHYINISRGEIAVEKDLIDGLRRGRPAFASLDVFETEPLPSSSPLWTMKNVSLTPHDSWRSPHTKSRNRELFLNNLRRYLSGRPLRNLVDFVKGY